MQKRNLYDYLKYIKIPGFLYSIEDEEEKGITIIWWVSTAITFISTTILMFFYYFAGYRLFSIFLLSHSIWWIICLTLFTYIQSGIEFFGFICQLFLIISSLIITVLLGGILPSGGMIIVGLIGPCYALAFPNKNRAIFLFIIYLMSVFCAAFFSNYTKSFEILTPKASLITFLLSLSISSLFLYFALFTFVKQRKKAIWQLREAQDKVEKAYSLLSKYVAPQLSENISEGQIEKIFNHYRKKLTLFFSDIKDFTRITDSMEPEDMASILNEYLTEMNDIVEKHKGTLAQVIGDALYVFYGAPESKSDKDNAIRCVNMAVEMQLKMEELNKKWFKDGVDEVFKIRCGINTGMTTVGGYGSIKRKEYTAMGMQTNIAARLEQNCEPGGILISHTTWALVNDEIPCSEKGFISVKGVHMPIRTYSIDFHSIKKTLNEVK